MLSITSIILLLIQFGLDAYTISHGTTMQFLDILDVFGYYLFGILGMILLVINNFWLHGTIYKLRQKKKSKKIKKAKHAVEEESLEEDSNEY